MTAVTKPNLVPPGPVPAWTGPAAWIPLVHYVLAVAAAGLAAGHSTFRLTPLVQVVVLIVAAGLVVVGTLVYFLERKASLASMAAYLRSVVPDILTVLDDAKGFSPSVAARLTDLEARLAPVVVPGYAAAQGATPVTPLPVAPVVVASPGSVAVAAPAEQAAPVAAPDIPPPSLP